MLTDILKNWFSPKVFLKKKKVHFPNNFIKLA